MNGEAWYVNDGLPLQAAMTAAISAGISYCVKTV